MAYPEQFIIPMRTDLTRHGVEEGVADGVKVVHAPSGGDDSLVAFAADSPDQVVLVSADRALRQRAESLGADVVGPRWLLDQLDASV